MRFLTQHLVSLLRDGIFPAVLDTRFCMLNRIKSSFSSAGCRHVCAPVLHGLRSSQTQSAHVELHFQCNPVHKDVAFSGPHSGCRYWLLAPLIVRFATNLFKHAHAVIERKRQDRSITNRRATRWDKNRWDDTIPFEQVMKGNILKVHADQYAIPSCPLFHAKNDLNTGMCLLIWLFFMQ